MLRHSVQEPFLRWVETVATPSMMCAVILPLHPSTPTSLTIQPVQFYIGRELNPSIGSFDIKSFNELRPGLMLWVLIDIGMICEQAVRRGGFDKVTDSMWLVFAFQSWYVLDGLYNEVRLDCHAVARSPLNVIPACHLHHDGHHHGWLWLHARRR